MRFFVIGDIFIGDTFYYFLVTNKEAKTLRLTTALVAHLRSQFNPVFAESLV